MHFQFYFIHSCFSAVITSMDILHQAAAHTACRYVQPSPAVSCMAQRSTVLPLEWIVWVQTPVNCGLIKAKKLYARMTPVRHTKLRLYRRLSSVTGVTGIEDTAFAVGDQGSNPSQDLATLISTHLLSTTFLYSLILLLTGVLERVPAGNG